MLTPAIFISDTFIWHFHLSGVTLERGWTSKPIFHQFLGLQVEPFFAATNLKQHLTVTKISLWHPSNILVFSFSFPVLPCQPHACKPFHKFAICQKLFIQYVIKGVFPGNPLIFTHVLVLNISCQHGGGNVRLKLYICIGYMLPTIGGIYVSYIYVGIGHSTHCHESILTQIFGNSQIWPWTL